MADPLFENRLFTSGKMNLDDSEELIPNGEYGVAFNIRPFDPQTGSVGVVTNQSGNELVDYDFDLGDNAFLRVVGSRLDLKRRRMYWLIYGNTFTNVQKSFVLYYDYETKAIETVFAFDNVLEFNPDSLISKVSIWYDDAIGDTLLWTDGASEPKKLNVLAGFNRFNNYVRDAGSFAVGDIVFADWQDNPASDAPLDLPFICTLTTTNYPSYNYSTGQVAPSANWKAMSIGECYPPYLLSEMFYQKPITPYFSPNSTFTYVDGTTSPATNLSGKTFQTRYKYVYSDGQESEWSPVSEAVASLELTSGVFDESDQVVVFDYPIPASLDIRVPISVLRFIGQDNYVEKPHSMVSRVRVAIREVPLRQAPTDWLELANIPIEDLFRYDISTDPISFDFPPAGTAGTYYYNWDTISFNQTTLNSRIVTITVPYTARETLIPIDIIDAVTNFYPVPKTAVCQDIINNKVVWGAVNQGMNVSQEIVSKMSQELAFTPTELPTSLSINQLSANIISWNSAATSISTTSTTATWVFDLDDTLNILDFLSPFSFNFSINLSVSFTSVIQPFVFSISGQSAIPSIDATFKAMVENAIQSKLPPTWTVSVNNTTGQLTITTTPTGAGVTGASGTISTKIGIDAFFRRQQLLPDRTYKAFSDQQFGFAFQDNAGRLSPVITGDWASTEIPHFINGDLEVVKHTVRINNIADIDVPQEARVMHILRKRSGSYDTFMQFALSRGNCPEQSWNFRKPFHVGLLNLTVDDFSALSFTIEKPEYLYITPNSMTGEDGGSYGTIFNRRKALKDSPAVSAARAELAAALIWKPSGILLGRKRLRDTRISNARLALSQAIASDDLQASLQPTSTPDLSDSDFAPRMTPQSGDLVRFLYDVNTDLEITNRYEATFIIKEYSELWNTIVLDFADIKLKEPVLAAYFEDNNSLAEGSTFVTRLVAEVIRPRTTSENEFYWEVAAQLSCTNGAVDINPDRDSLQLFGDAYIKLRGQFTTYVPTVSVTQQNFAMQDPDYSDFFESNNVGEGRANAEIKSIQTRGNYYSSVQRDNLAIHSETTIQETDSSQLGTVYDGNLLEADNVFGRIEYLDAEGDVLNIYQEDKRARIFSGRSITTELSGAERVLATTSQAFSDISYQQGVFGISKDGTSFAKSGYRKYYVDSKRGAVYRESLDGITPISSIKMENYFKKLFRNYRNSSKQGIVRGFFDETFDEYIIVATYWKTLDATIAAFSGGVMTVNIPAESSYFQSFPNGLRFTVIPQAEPVDPSFRATSQGNQVGTTVNFLYNGDNPVNSGPIKIEAPITEVAVFSEKTSGWTTFLSYDAEWGESGIQSYHTFVDGQMYVHEFDNEDYCTFHGREFPMSVEVHSNSEAHLTKYWLTVGLKTKTEDIEIPEITTSENQESYIPSASFENREGTQWSEFYGEGGGDDIIEGDRLRGRWLKAKVEVPIYEANENKVEIFGVIFNSKPSGFTR